MAESEDRALAVMATELNDEEEGVSADYAHTHGDIGPYLQNAGSHRENLQRFRVKIYELDGENVWEDKGTGTCAVVYVEVLAHALHSLLFTRARPRMLSALLYGQKRTSRSFWRVQS